MKNKDILLAFSCILIGFIYRLIPGHPANFTPVAAMALVGGLYIDRRWIAFLIPIIALYMGDLILNNTILRSFYPEQTGFILWNKYMIFNFLAMGLTVGLGILLKNNRTSTKMVAGGLFASVVFYLITNLGSWISLPMYPKTGAGLLASYTAGIPFFRSTLIGNMAFAIVFIGSIEMMRTRLFVKPNKVL